MKFEVFTFLKMHTTPWGMGTSAPMSRNALCPSSG